MVLGIGLGQQEDEHYMQYIENVRAHPHLTHFHQLKGH